MRLAVVAVLTAFVLAAPGGAAPTAANPMLRIGTATPLTLVGTGFAPRVLLRIRMAGPDTARRTTVRTTLRGGFVIRFADLERCSIDSAAAITPNGAWVRVPPSFFVRECPPPPPLAPGPPPAA